MTTAAVAAVAGCGSPSSPVPQVTPGLPVLGDWDPPQVHVDAPYVQEGSTVVGSLDDVRALVLDGAGRCHVATAEGVVRYEEMSFRALYTLMRYPYVRRGDGHQEPSGTFGLLPYWMARYWGLIR